MKMINIEGAYYNPYGISEIYPTTPFGKQYIAYIEFGEKHQISIIRDTAKELNYIVKDILDQISNSTCGDYNQQVKLSNNYTPRNFKH